jgi:hypothetical protein
MTESELACLSMERQAQILQHAINNHMQVISANLELLDMRQQDPAILRRTERNRTAMTAVETQTRTFPNRLRGTP